MKIAAISIVSKVATIPGTIHKIIPNTIPVIPNVTNLFVRLVSLCNVFFKASPSINLAIPEQKIHRANKFGIKVALLTSSALNNQIAKITVITPFSKYQSSLLFELKYPTISEIPANNITIENNTLKVIIFPTGFTNIYIPRTKKIIPTINEKYLVLFIISSPHLNNMLFIIA